MKKTRRKTVRLAKSGTDVVAVDLADGSTEYTRNPKMAAQLTTFPVEIIETKAEADDRPHCESCKRPAGRAADGRVVILAPSKGQSICLDCAADAKAIADAETETKAEKIGQGSNFSYRPTSGYGSTEMAQRRLPNPRMAVHPMETEPTPSALVEHCVYGWSERACKGP